MTTAADDSAVEDAFEALLAGRPVPEGAAGLAAFTEAVRTGATRQGRPNAALAELLATGLLADHPSPSVRTARSAGSARQPRRSRVRTRRPTAMIFSALLAKFLSAGAVAQAATGATVAVVAFTGVGAVGALPGPVQDTFTTVVAEVVPVGPSTTETTTGTATEDVVPVDTVPVEVQAPDAATADVAVVDDVELEAEAWALEGPADGEAFGAWVGKGSKDDVKAWLQARGMTFGDVVSAWANGRGYSDEELAALGADLEEPTGSTTDVEVEDAPEPEQAEAEAEDRGSPGKGNGNGKSDDKSDDKSGGRSEGKSKENGKD